MSRRSQRFRQASPSRRWTKAFGAASVGATVAVLVSEYVTVWRHGRAPAPFEADDVGAAAVEAARETVEIAVEGYKHGTPREVALFNLLTTFALSWGVVRLSTHRIRSHGRFLFFRDLKIGDGDDARHIHHFVPGIGLALIAGGASIVSRDEGLDKFLAVPFGLGAALVLDESALLLELDDVYWTEDGVLSVQVTLAAMALLTLLAAGLRLLRRGEAEVFSLEEEPSPPDPDLALESPA